MYTALVVDDDDFIRQLIRKKLETEGYHVIEACNKETLLSQLERHEQPHIILLDVMLDKSNGIELIEEIKRFNDAPIIMVSSKDHLFDKIVALEMGADDYIAKPFEPKELLSRIKANVRRYVGSANITDTKTDGRDGMKFGSWTVDQTTYSIRNDNGDDAGLTKDEFDLFVTLARTPNVVFTRDQLFNILKKDNYDSFDRAIDIQIARIRKKLGDSAQSPSIIKTIRKVGYQFIAPTESDD